MKKIILVASLSAFLAAPLLACDGMGGEHDKDKASLSTEKPVLKADAKSTKAKAKKSVAAVTTKKAKI
jgi:hypothetical protein